MTQDWQKQWNEQGYLVIPGLFDPSRSAQLRGIGDRILAQWLRCDPQTGKPGNPDGHALRHLNHADYFKGRPAGEFSVLMDAVADELVLGGARAILGEDALFRCTTYWFNPATVSQDGPWHRDIQFTSKTEEEERGKLERSLTAHDNGIQLQVALVPSEDIEFVPGSHLRWDTPAEYAIRCANGRADNRSNQMPGALRLPLRAGDVALFNPNGLHRGRYHADKLRRTLMLTYTKTSCPCSDYFSDQPWFLEPGHLDGLRPRTRAFFAPFMELYREFWLRKDEKKAA